MSRQVTASFATRQDADAAQARLIAAGVDPGRIVIEAPPHSEQTPAGGLFDRLADFLAPGQAPAPGGYVLSAEVLPQQLDAATAALATQTTAARAPKLETTLREHVVELIETAEELVVEKEQVVREEVVLRKSVVTHVEEVIGSERKMEVEVERIPPGEDQPGTNL